MKIRITGVGNRARDFYTSRTFDLGNILDMSRAVQCWKSHKSKYDKLDIIDAKTGKEPIADPDDIFEELSTFRARIK